MACQTCRLRKIKCDSARPTCSNCAQGRTACSYSGERRKRLKLADGGGVPFTRAFRFVEQRYSPQRGINARKSNVTSSKRSCNRPARLSRNDARRNLDGDLDRPRTPTVPTCFNLPSEWTAGDVEDLVNRNTSSPPANPSINSHASPNQIQSPSFESTPSQFGGGWLVDRILEGDSIACRKDSNPSVWIRTNDGDEYTGPSSGLSAISDRGLLWLQTHVEGSEDLCNTISDIGTAIFNHLRHPKCLAPGSWQSALDQNDFTPLPDKQTAAKYIDCYFDQVQTIFPILDRDLFDQRVAQFAAEGVNQTYAWLALFNAVIASGCRAALSDETSDGFQDSGRRAWSYFQNALYYESKLVNGSTDLLAVQALAVMTTFAQGMSSPQRLEYTLSSTMCRLAQSVALHRAPSGIWNLTEEEEEERKRTFWVVYCLDKTINLRTGRPSVIHDDEVSCPFPQHIGRVQRGSPEIGSKVSFFLLFTRFARICSNISLLLYSASALCQESSALFTTANRLLADLESWRQGVPERIRPGQSFKNVGNSVESDRMQLLVLHSSYYYALCAIYKRFAAPFVDNDNGDQCKLLRSRRTSLEAARSMLLLSKYIDAESYTPGWCVNSPISLAAFLHKGIISSVSSQLNRLSFYYPMVALTTIFLHVVLNPRDPRANNDIALMETAIGLFGRLEYVTSGEAAFTKTREFIRKARTIVRVQANPMASFIGRTNTGQMPSSLDFIENVDSITPTSLLEEGHHADQEQCNDDDLTLDSDMDLLLESWGERDAMPWLNMQQKEIDLFVSTP